MNTPFTDSVLRRAYSLARLRGKLRPDSMEDPNSLPLVLVPRRSIVREQRTVARKMTRTRQPMSVMNMGQPAWHKIAAVPDERTARLFAAHERRQAAGWIRG